MEEEYTDAHRDELIDIAREENRKEGEHNGEISDGYHTFSELYDHRNLLFINLCKTLKNDFTVYVVEEHYEKHFLLVLHSNLGQISYHIGNELLYLVKDFKRRTSDEHNWDGHTSDDVIKILKNKDCLN